MKTTVYLLIMTLTYPIWWITIKLTDLIFALERRLRFWVENDNEYGK